jgi:uncharacterized protein YneF (UPF0154 family)
MKIILAVIGIICLGFILVIILGAYYQRKTSKELEDDGFYD